MAKMITLRVTDERLAAIDRLVAHGDHASRAAVLNAAIDRLLREAERRRIDEQIVEGYRRIPPTLEEDAWAEVSTRESIRSEPW